MPADGNGRNPSPTPAHSEDWRQLAEEASREMDRDKLIELVQRLCEELEKHGPISKNVLQPKT